MATPEQTFFGPVGIYPATKSGFTSTPHGFSLSFANGWTASVQFGLGNYGSNRDIPDDSHGFIHATTAEIAAMPTEDMYWADGSRHRLSWYKPDGEQEVGGWCPVGEVMDFLNTIHDLPHYTIERDCVCGTCINIALHSIICTACGKQNCQDNIVGFDMAHVSDEDIKTRWCSQCVCDLIAIHGDIKECPNHSEAYLFNQEQENN